MNKFIFTILSFWGTFWWLNQSSITSETVYWMLKKDNFFYRLIFSLSTFTKFKVIHNQEEAEKISSLNTYKTGLTYYILSSLIGGKNGNLISSTKNDIFYKKHRSILYEMMNNLFFKNKKKISNIIKIYINNLENNIEINIKPVIFELISYIFGNIILGIENKETIEKLRKNFLIILKDFSNRPQVHLMQFLQYFPNHNNNKIKKAKKIIDDIFSNIFLFSDSVIVSYLRKNCAEKESITLLKLLFFAGFETTSNQLCFLILELSNNIDIQEKIRNELFSNKTGSETLRHIIFKTIWKYPIVNTTMRTHNNTTYAFMTEDIHKCPGKNYSFQVGKRQCMGKKMAIEEMKLISSEILLNFNIKLKGNKPKIKHYLTTELENLNIILENKYNYNTNYENNSIIYEGIKYNINSYINNHPGGKSILKQYNNQDITEAFNSIHHSKKALNILKKLPKI